MKKIENKNIIWLIKIILTWITIISISIEMICFPSWANLAGCIMMVISYIVFVKFFLKREIIINAPFSFFMFLSMFLYRYMPLLGTILEGKPISYGMENPIDTFIMETILFIISCIAFYLSLKKVKEVSFLQRGLNTLGFYKQGNEKVFWILGILGVISTVSALSMGKIETGDVFGRLFKVLYFYIYSPVILFFPCLYRLNSEKKIDLKNKKVWLYLIFISILNLASNSRNKIITPFCIFILLLLLVLARNNISMKKILKPSKVLRSLVIIIIGLSTMSMVSKAMLINRSIRDELSFTELIESTVETLTSENIDKIWNDRVNNIHISKNYEQGWTEDYIDNYFYRSRNNSLTHHFASTDHHQYDSNHLND